jgi:1-acyl-sn-glycerol-3-phosphate acyltransferase
MWTLTWPENSLKKTLPHSRVLLLPLQAVIIILATILIPPLVIAFSLLGRQAVAYNCVKAWCQVMIRISGVRYTIRGLENLPADGSYVIIANHRSHFDGPTLILALPHRFYFVIKRELTRIPLWGQAVVKLGYIPIDRGQSHKARAQMAEAADVVRNGRRILVFPEGTRSTSEQMLRFKKGGFHLACDAQVPIVPIAINRSRTVLPKGSLCPRPGKIEYVIGKPIPTAGLTKEEIPILLNRTLAAIEAMRG